LSDPLFFNQALRVHTLALKAETHMLQSIQKRKLSVFTLVLAAVAAAPTAFADPVNQSPSTSKQCERVITSNTTPEGFTPVGQAQRELCHRGLYTGPVDGINGPLTHEALKQYQSDKHLQVTGELNQQTALALGLMVGGPGIQAGPGTGTT
jgi:peptidoglycan hydrolase-like protein with peptidoglycan-binding domain